MLGPRYERTCLRLANHPSNARQHRLSCSPFYGSFMRFIVVTIVAVDQQLHTGIPILADQVDGLGHCADKT